MANHPITLISPTQVIQSSEAFNNDQFSPSNSSTPPTAGQGETSTGVSGGTGEASVTVSPGTVAPDAYAMQANDSTAFVFGSTAANQSAASNQYTTVDDTAKSSIQAAMVQDQMIAPIGERGSRRPPLKKKKKEGAMTATGSEEEDEDEVAPTRPYSADAKKTLARLREKGIVII